MKLHLPKCLFVALMSLFPLATMAEDASTPPASYGKLITVETLPAIELDNTHNSMSVNHTLLSDGNGKSWVLNLKATNITPEATDVSSSRTATLLRFGAMGTRVVENEKKWSVSSPDGAFYLFVAPDSDLALIYNSKGDDDKQKSKTLSGTKNFSWELISEVNLTLSYNAAEQVLSLISGSITRTDSTKTITPIPQISYAIPDNFFAADQLKFDGGAGSTLVSTLMAEGAEDGWRIQGRTSLQDLKNGVYGMTAMDSSHKVQFLGADGIIYSTDNDTFTNTVTTAVDMENLEEDIGMGFGAAAGKTLTVTTATSSINNAEGTALIDKLTIVGDGTVKLQYATGNTGNLFEVSVNIADKATLEINSEGTAQIDLSKGTFSSAASIVKSGGTAADSALWIDVGGATTSLARLSNTTGTMEIVNPGTIAAASIEATGVRVTGGTNVQAGTLTAGTGGLNVDPMSKVAAANSIDITGGTLTAYGAVTAGQTISAESIEASGSGSIAAAEITAKDISAAGVTIDSTSGTTLTGNARIGASGISANAISSGANISFDSTSTGSVVTKSLSNASISSAGNDIATNASTDSSIAISKDTMVATGKLSASTIDLGESYNLSASELETNSLTDGDTSITGTSNTSQNISVYTDASGTRVLNASSIDAESVTIGGNTKLTGADITTTQGVVVKDEGSLQDVSIQGGSLTNDGIANLDNVAFVTDGTGNANTTTNFGGTSGDAVSITNNVDSVQVSGTMDGSKATISKLVLNAENLAFDTEGQATPYTIITGTDIDYTYDAERDQINIAPYVRAQLTTDAQGNIQVVGTRDTEGIKSELANTHNRRVAIKAIDEARASAPSSYAQTNATSTPLDAIYDYVGHVNRYSAAERQNVLSAVSGASTALLADSQRRGLRDVQDNLRNRIIQMGGGTNAGLITDWEYVGLQAWAQADGGLATTDGSGDEWGYDFNTSGATVGANIDLTANLVIGTSFSVSYGELDVDSTDNAKGNNDAQYVSFFARHNKERWVQMFIFTYGMNDMDMERSILGYNAKGDTKGTTLSAYYELGYTFGLDYEYTHILQPMVSISFTSASIDGYREEGSIGNAGIDYADNDYTYLQLAVGARYQGVLYETIHERNAVIEARALITQDFGDATNEAEAALAGSGQYTVKCADSSGTGFKLGAGVSIPVEQHTTLYADADFTYAPDYTGLRANIGVRYDF